MGDGGNVMWRSHLLDRIGVPGADLPPLSVFSAPQGFGKTTLLRQWAQTLEPKQTVIWVSAADVPCAAQLWCRIAAQVPWPRISHPEDSELCDDDRCREAVMAWLTNVTRPVIVMIDDFHEVTAASVDAQTLKILESSPHAYLLVAGSHFSSLDTPLLTSRLDSRVFSASDLAFTESEVAVLLDFRRSSQEPPGSLAVELVAAQPIASAAVLRLMTNFAEPERRQWLRDYARLVVRDDLETQILGICANVGGASKSLLSEVLSISSQNLREPLQRLKVTGFLQETLDGTRKAYSLCPGLADGLLWAELAGLNDADFTRIAARRDRASVSADASRVLRSLLQDGEFSAAEDLARRAVSYLVAQPDPFVKALSEVPVSALSPHPMLLGLRLLLHQAESVASVTSMDLLAEKLTASIGDLGASDPGDLDSIHLALLVAAERVLGHWKLAHRHAQWLEAKLSEHRHRDHWRDQSGLPIMYAVVSLTGILVGDYGLAQRTSERGLRLAVEEGNVSEQLRALNLQALIRALQGDLAGAVRFLGEADDVAAASSITPPDLSIVNQHLAAAVAAILDGRPSDAGPQLAQVEHLLSGSETWHLFVIVEAWSVRLSKGSTAALARLRSRIEKEKHHRLSPFASSQLMSAMANLAMYDGNPRVAKRLLKTAPSETMSVVIARARMAILEGSEWDAVALLEPYFGAEDGSYQNCEVVLLGAVALLGAGDRSSAVALLEDLDLDMSPSYLRALFSTVPYGALLALATAAATAASGRGSDTSSGRLLNLVQELPIEYRLDVPEPLSRLELEVLQAIVHHQTVNRTAEHLRISVNTVKSRLRQIYSKLKVRSRSEMLLAARRQGLL